MGDPMNLGASGAFAIFVFPEVFWPPEGGAQPVFNAESGEQNADENSAQEIYRITGGDETGGEIFSMTRRAGVSDQRFSRS